MDILHKRNLEASAFVPLCTKTRPDRENDQPGWAGSFEKMKGGKKRVYHFWKEGQAT